MVHTGPMRRTRELAGIVSIALLIAACGSGSAAETTTAPEATSSTTLASSNESTTTLAGPPPAPSTDLGGLPDWFQNEDAAPTGLINVISEELGAAYVGSMPVEWPTGALGCESGGSDLQVVTPGYVLFFQSEDSLHRVHAAENGRWIECDLARPLEGTPVLTS